MIAFGLRFVLLAGDPYIDGSMGGVGKPEYSGYIYGDNNYLFCECHECGEIGIEFEARGARISCKCDHSTHGNGDKCYAELSPKLYRAYNAARSARFEHGETP